MKLKYFLVAFFIFVNLNVFSQSSNFILFTNNPAQKFRLIINGNLQINTFEESVRVENVEAGIYQIRVVFENRFLGYIEKTVNVRPNTEKIYTFVQQKPLQGRRRIDQGAGSSPLALELVSELPRFSVDDEYMGDENDANDAVSYTTTQSPEGTNGGIKYENGNVVIGNESNNISIGTKGIDFNIDIDNIIEKIATENGENNKRNNSRPNQNNEIVEISDNQNTNCTPSFNDTQFLQITKSLEREAMESKRLSAAKYVCNNNYLLTKQVRDIVHLFNFENNRVEFAKFAYSRVADKENYALLLDSFKFETSKQEIKEYINEL